MAHRSHLAASACDCPTTMRAHCEHRSSKSTKLGDDGGISLCMRMIGQVSPVGLGRVARTER